MTPDPDLSAPGLRDAFDAKVPLTIGLEEEVMLLDPETLDLAPRAREVLERLDGDSRFKGELPAAQLEILTPPLRSAEEAIATLAEGRQVLARAAAELALPAVAAVHPFAAGEGELSTGGRYAQIGERYGVIARRQLVSSLQIHVSVGDAERTLAVYNALRSFLPEIAALSANGPFYEGRDSGLASVRPMIAQLLPRQGVPPLLRSWEELAGELRWGAVAGAVEEPRLWWWELRPHPGFGTLEIRVPDAQTELDATAAVAAFVHALVAHLSERHREGEAPAITSTWRIEENSWSAARDGVEGEMADLETGQRGPTRERLRRLLVELQGHAEQLDCENALSKVHDLLEANGAMRQRAVAGKAGVDGLAAWLAERFAPRAASADPVLPR